MVRVAAALILLLAGCSKEDGRLAGPRPPEPAPAPAQTADAAPVLAKDAESPPPARLEGYRLSGPHARGNLAIYLLHDPSAPAGDLGCLSLEEGLRSGAVKVTEKAGGAEVNELQIENAGEKPVYLQAGDTVKGGQQDRTIAVDVVLPAKSGKRAIEAFCVEPGRWSVRDQAGPSTLAYAGASFALADFPTPVATREQKLAVRLSKSQEDVWSAGKAVNEDLKAKVVSASSGGRGPAVAEEPKNSFVEAVEDPAVAKKVDEIVAGLSTILDGNADAVGAAFCINGKLQNIEVYTAAGLFRKLWPKLLRAAAVEAFAKAGKGEAPKPPAESELKGVLSALEGQKGRAEVRPEGPTVRIFERDHAVLFDTESGGRLLHHQVLTK